jgi:hypothetical protein
VKLAGDPNPSSTTADDATTTIMGGKVGIGDGTGAVGPLGDTAEVLGGRAFSCAARD